MFYEFAVTVPASTPSDDPLIVDAPLVAGLITHVAVQFPRGCVGLVHASINRAIHQIWPTNTGGDIAGDQVIVEWDEQYELNEDPEVLQLHLWNEDDTFPHTIAFRFAVLGAAELARTRAQSRVFDVLGQALGVKPAT